MGSTSRFLAYYAFFGRFSACFGIFFFTFQRLFLTMLEQSVMLGTAANVKTPFQASLSGKRDKEDYGSRKNDTDAIDSLSG
jgi:hypothetical protein